MTRRKQKCIEKVEKLYDSYDKLRKNSNRKSIGQQNKEQEFVSNFDNLFDIAHTDIINMISKEKMEFLSCQREPGRRGHIGGLECIESVDATTQIDESMSY
ncbi:PREDICTED: uncharacterized protein LOC108775072 [Cyphomyrmex costatus]|nr:PREDICTED: uncharacterized protein LOC108775072 [Cyphomyrmex costatus]